MILGKGLLATAFQKVEDKFNDALVIAAGVSNSVSCLQADFDREAAFLKDSLKLAELSGLKVMYFGTTSIYDPLKAQSAYVKHKIEMERLVMRTSQSFVLRLPNLVGPSLNPHTLVNYLVSAIEHGLAYQAYINQKRYLVDVEWVPQVARALLNKEMHTENMCLNEGIKVADLISMIELVLNKKSNHIDLNQDNDFEIPVSQEFRDVVRDLSLPWGQEFEFELLKKYVS